MTPSPFDPSRNVDVFHRQWRRLYRSGTRIRRSLAHRIGPKVPGSEYDAQTVEVMRRVLARGSNGIDIGAACGELLRPMVTLAPAGHHRAIEPQADLAAKLREEFPDVEVNQLALSDRNGEAEFFFAVDAPGYSGLHRRPYPTDEMRVEIHTVETRRLDDLVDLDEPIVFIKIDVEGAEFEVLRGARQCLSRYHPFVVFEYSGGMIPEVAVSTEEFYDFWSQLGFGLSTLEQWLRGDAPLRCSEFPSRRSDQGWHWMFVAYERQ